MADLCPTPLLRIYTSLRDRDLLDIANIVSMDVFNWAEALEEKFDFVAADHFVDLFSSKGRFNQTRVLLTLMQALTPGGTLALTVRCGTEGKELTRDQVMNDFYTRCQQALAFLTSELERTDTTEGDLYKGKYSNIFSTKQELARGIYTLASYLTLRDVNPFANTETLSHLLEEIKRHTGKNFTFDISPLEGKTNKVFICIKKEY